MTPRLLALYHRLPGSARSAAASLRGCYLRAWRYGKDHEERVAATLERDRWPADRWTSWQEEQLARLLDRAARRVPYYRAVWSARRQHGDRASWERLEHWPVLPKRALRDSPEAFVADDRDVRRMYPEHTSGSTGTPLRLWWSQETVHAWYALFEARVRRWHGVSWREPWGMLGGQAVAPPNARRPPYWVHNWPMHQLYLSTGHLSSATAPAYLQALRAHGASHILAYPSAAAILAAAARERGESLPDLRVVISNAEPLLPWQRQAMADGFGCSTRETYGMAELVAAASECERGARHVWPEAGWIEVLNDLNDDAVPPDTPGRLVCTGLLNVDMPLIRYDVGDRGRTASSATCTCGRSMSVISGIEGRSNDVLRTRDGRRVHWINPIFYQLPVREGQLVQESLDAVRVLIVPAPGYDERTEADIEARLRARAGNAFVIRFEQVSSIPRGAQGKLQTIRSLLTEPERV